MISSLFVLVTFLHFLSFVEAACISKTHYEAATSTITTPSTALITGQPDLKLRDVNSICGLWSTWGPDLETSTISCDTGVPCVFQSYSSGTVIGYCSSKDAQVKTEAFNYGLGPANGCSPNQLCCDATNTAWGVYVFGAGASTLTMCGSTRFWQTATATIAAIQAPSNTTSSSPTATSAPAKNSSNTFSTPQIIGIVFGALGGLGAFAGGAVTIIKYCKNPDVDDSGATGRREEAIRMEHTGKNSTNPAYHFHGPVNVLFRESEVHLHGVSGGMGSHTKLIASSAGGSRNASRKLLIKGR